MAFCTKCGSKIEEGEKFCKGCGTPVETVPAQQQTAQFVTQQQELQQVFKPAENVPLLKDNKRIALTSLVLGITGLAAWYFPIAGFPVTIIGLITGVIGQKSSKKKMAIAGLVLSIIGLAATIVNSAIGAYQGATGQLPGSITITGIPSKYNDKYAVGEGFLDIGKDQIEFILVANDVNQVMDIKGGKIKNGTVTLKVLEEKGEGLFLFTGSGEGMIDDLLFFDSASDFNNSIGGGDGKVIFSNGIGTTSLIYW
jgi:hypothetical protein